jgi:hypothetical protein
MAWAVIRCSLTVKARVRSQESHVTFGLDKVTLGQVSVRVRLFYSVGIIPPMLRTRVSSVCDRGCRNLY